MRVIMDVLRRKSGGILLILVCNTVNISVMLLYGERAEPALYSFAVSLFFLTVMIIRDVVRGINQLRQRESAALSVNDGNAVLPEPQNIAEEDYQAMIVELRKSINRITDEYSSVRQDSIDYYTAWVHQIKTPISVLRMKLSDDTPENRSLLAEVFRIEQYVDMVLQYIRLGSETNDLVIKEYSLDDMIKKSVRKYASQFIAKKLSITLDVDGTVVVTDSKWFCCILDQFLSNAVKYTREGSVTVTADEFSVTVRDTGPGIAPEDLPRIFEKGYTGKNGRAGQNSSGLGLYLAGKAAGLLSLKLSAESEPGHGSCFTIHLK